jgi:DNA ligase D
MPGRYVAAVPASSPVVIEVDGREVRITSPDKVFFSERGETKLDLVHHYLRVAEPIRKTMGGRPTLMQRFPDGADGSSFFQKRVPKGAPDWLHTTVMSTPNGTTSDAMVVADLAHIAWAVNMGCLGFHPWPLRADDLAHTDELRIDLDPGPGVDFPMVRETAHELRTFLDEVGIASFPKTTGNRGIHVYARLLPLWDSYDVRGAAVAVARELERRRPELVTAAWWKEERGERVFVDFNQNAPHKTVFGAWCVRPRPGGQVSTPFRWEELDGIEPDALTMPAVAGRLADDGDPWAEMDDQAQSIEPLLERWRADIDDGTGDAPWPPVYPKMPYEPPRVAPSRARDPDDPPRR